MGIGCLLEFLELGLDFNIKTFSIKMIVIEKKMDWKTLGTKCAVRRLKAPFNNGIFSSYTCWFDAAWTKLSAVGTSGRGLIISFYNP